MKENQIPMYVTIKMDLIEKIKNKNYDPDLPLCTEKSLSEQYQVSRITSKRAIDELEKDGLIERKRGVGSFVRKKDHPEQYTIPSPHTPDSSYKMMALMIPCHFDRLGIFAAINTVSNTLATADIYLTLRVYTPGVTVEGAMVTELYEANSDGIIYYPSTSHLPIEALDLYCRDNKPVVIIDKPHSYERYSSVSCDNFQGSYLLTSHLLAYGHKNTCYLSRFSGEDVSSIKQRYDGYVKAIRDKNSDIKPYFFQLELSAHYDFPMLTHIINKLYKEGVTAFICENDEVAFHVYMCCRSLALRLPDDVSISGFDNIEWATMADARLTTVRQDFALIGKAIADILLQSNYLPIHTVIPVKLVPRTSTGMVPQKGRQPL